ncbi:hypothetical protein BV20DRAFT_806848 [Pilatotrama ljubarskyi]|nr:hypothetical protein BV20DRAFT_806848 [Pilatotrama ljubarskyi]
MWAGMWAIARKGLAIAQTRRLALALASLSHTLRPSARTPHPLAGCPSTPRSLLPTTSPTPSTPLAALGLRYGDRRFPGEFMSGASGTLPCTPALITVISVPLDAFTSIVISNVFMNPQRALVRQISPGCCLRISLARNSLPDLVPCRALPCLGHDG